MSELRPGVIFDVDGTLVDTNYLHTMAWARALHDVGEWAPMNAIHRLIGMGGDNLVPELLGHSSPEAEAARSGRYRELRAEVRVFPGAVALLRALHSAGLRIVLATSAPQDELDAVLALLDCDEAIDAKTTADDVAASKPAGDIFRAALRTGSIDPQRAVVVGDSVWDVRAAKAAELGCVGVESGGFSRQELDAEGALHVYRDVEDVLLHYRTGPLGRLLDGKR